MTCETSAMRNACGTSKSKAWQTNGWKDQQRDSYVALYFAGARKKTEVPQSPDARLSWALVVRGFISMINIAKMQEKYRETEIPWL